MVPNVPHPSGGHLRDMDEPFNARELVKFDIRPVVLYSLDRSNDEVSHFGEDDLRSLGRHSAGLFSSSTTVVLLRESWPFHRQAGLRSRHRRCTLRNCWISQKQSAHWRISDTLLEGICFVVLELVSFSSLCSDLQLS